MTHPGDRLRRLASKLCRPEAMTRLIDPVIADLQCEYGEALKSGAIWRARRVRAAGYVAFWKVLSLQLASEVPRVVSEWATADDRAIARTLAFSAAVAAILTASFVLFAVWSTEQAVTHGAYLPGFAVRHLPTLLVYLIPQGLGLAIPAGLAIGIVSGLRGRAATRQTRQSILAIGVVCSVLMFAVLAWIAPAANQAYRDLAAERHTAKGVYELTLDELGSRGARFEYHVRWAGSIAPIVLALFAYAVSSVTRRTTVGIPIVAAAAIAYPFAYPMFGLPVLWGWVPPAAGAWMPNGMYVLLTAVMFHIAIRFDSQRLPSRSG